MRRGPQRTLNLKYLAVNIAFNWLEMIFGENPVLNIIARSLNGSARIIDSNLVYYGSGWLLGLPCEEFLVSVGEIR